MKKIIIFGLILCTKLAMSVDGSQASEDEQKKHEQQQEEVSKDLSLEEILNSPHQIKNLSIEEIGKFNFLHVSPEVFLELSKESIMALLERLEFLAKFNQKQWDNLILNIIGKLNFETYDDLWQKLELNINFIITKTDFLNKLNAMQIEKVSPLIFKKLLPEVFKKLSPEKISQLTFYQLEGLTKDQFDALDETQVQAINSLQLSKALKNKLLQPLDVSFVEKLSLEEIRNLLGNHTGFRFKNWGSMFKDNFTQEALKYMKDKKSEADALAVVKSFDGVSLNDLELYRLRKATKRLSKELREDILSKFQEKQDKHKAILLGQFKKISMVAPAKLAQRILWTKASHIILVKLPSGYQKIEIALGLRTKEQVSKLNEIFNNIKNNSSHFISAETVRALKLDENDKKYLMQRVKDFNELFKIGIKIDPKIKERKSKI